MAAYFVASECEYRLGDVPPKRKMSYVVCHSHHFIVVSYFALYLWQVYSPTTWISELLLGCSLAWI